MCVCMCVYTHFIIYMYINKNTKRCVYKNSIEVSLNREIGNIQCPFLLLYKSFEISIYSCVFLGKLLRML